MFLLGEGWGETEPCFKSQLFKVDTVCCGHGIQWTVEQKPNSSSVQTIYKNITDFRGVLLLCVMSSWSNKDCLIHS